MSVLRRYAVIAPVGVSIAFLVASCSDTKVSQCQRLITVVNQGSSLVEKSKGKQATTTIKLANDLNSVTKSLNDINLKDTELKSYQNRFAKTFDTLSRTIANAGKALETAHKAESSPAGRFKLQKSKQEMEKSLKAASAAARQADKLAGEVNTYCNQQEIITNK